VWRNAFWGLSDAMVKNPQPWVGKHLLPDIEPGWAYHVLSSFAFSKVKYIIETTVASGLIFLTSSARDFKNPEIRPYIDKYMRGSNGYSALDRAKLLKLLWDAIGSEFGSRHELYEINYGGSVEEIRRFPLFSAEALGTAAKLTGFAEQCMAEYDIDGWKVPDLADPGELSYHVLRNAEKAGLRTVGGSDSGDGRTGGAGGGGGGGSGKPGAGRSYPGGFRNPFAER
jgi:4-hydroxyphenylacetate 3-monooxygenase